MNEAEKPIVIEAIEWTGDNLKEVINFTGLKPSPTHWTWERYEQIVKNNGLCILNSKGYYSVSIGDVMIKKEQGEFYPYKPAELLKGGWWYGTCDRGAEAFLELLGAKEL